MQSLLITGGCGFVGSNLCILFKKRYPQLKVIAFDNLKRRGSEINLPRLQKAGVEFVHGDVRNKQDLEAITEVDTVIDAAAEPSVLAGISESPDYLIHTNLNGTLHLLELAKKYKSRFIFLSTSRVYPIKNFEKIKLIQNETRFEIANDQVLPGISPRGISEKFPLEGSRSLYGSSKLASEFFIAEYHSLFGLKTVINRCGVLTGPFQMGKVDQGVVVLWMAKHFWKGKLSYIGYEGKGLQVRDILHINDLFELLDFQIHNIDSFNGEVFNIGGGREVSLSLLELTRYCEEITGNRIEILAIPETRVADIPVYLTDNQKIMDACKWSPKTNTREILVDIYNWIRNNEMQLKPILQ